MHFENALAGVAVKDLPKSVAWYERMLEATAQRPMPEVAEWEFHRGGWLQVFEDGERAGSSSVTLSVDDLDETVQTLGEKGFEVERQPPSTRVKLARLSDPDGNQIFLAQAIDHALAR